MAPRAQTSAEVELPKSVQDVDRVDLSAVVLAAQPKLFPKLAKALEKDKGLKMRKIGKNQCKALADLFLLHAYV